MLAEVWATYHDSRHFTMAMMYTRRLPLHTAVSSLLGNFYTVVPLEVDLRAGCSLNGLLEGLQAETLEVHRHRWCSGIDVMQKLNAVFNRTGRPAVPFVISSALASGKGTFISSSAFAGAGRSAYAPPQVLADVIASKGADGSLSIRYHRNHTAFPSGMQHDVLEAFKGLVGQLSGDLSAWSLSRLILESQSVQRLLRGKNSAHQPVSPLILCDGLSKHVPELHSRVAVATPSVRLKYAEFLA